MKLRKYLLGLLCSQFSCVLAFCSGFCLVYWAASFSELTPAQKL